MAPLTRPQSTSVELQLGFVQNIEFKLCSIVRDQDVSSTIRCSAIDILVLSLSYYNRVFYEDVLKKERDPMIIEALVFCIGNVIAAARYKSCNSGEGMVWQTRNTLIFSGKE